MLPRATVQRVLPLSAIFASKTNSAVNFESKGEDHCVGPRTARPHTIVAVACVAFGLTVLALPSHILAQLSFLWRGLTPNGFLFRVLGRSAGPLFVPLRFPRLFAFTLQVTPWGAHYLAGTGKNETYLV